MRAITAFLLCGCIGVALISAARAVRVDRIAQASLLASDNPPQIRIIPAIGGKLADLAFSDGKSIHFNSDLCAAVNCPRPFILKHEEYHILYSHGRESLDDENAADRYAALNISTSELADAAKWFRWLHRRGLYEKGEHAPFLERAKILSDILADRLKVDGVAPVAAGCTKEDYRNLPKGAVLLECGSVTIDRHARKARR